MSDYELLSLYNEYQSNWISLMAFILTLLASYLVATFLGAARLGNFQFYCTDGYVPGVFVDTFFGYEIPGTTLCFHWLRTGKTHRGTGLTHRLHIHDNHSRTAGRGHAGCLCSRCACGRVRPAYPKSDPQEAGWLVRFPGCPGFATEGPD